MSIKDVQANIRKTKDIWCVTAKYDRVTGYEVVYWAVDYRDARERLKEYNSSEPLYPHRISLKREKIEEVKQ